MNAHDHRPNRTYLGLMGLFHAGLTLLARRAEKGRVHRMALSDVVLCGLAAHQVSHLLAQEKVSRPLREPFVDETPSGDEVPRGGGVRRAIGELITCPFCLSPWTALGFAALFQLSPDAARVTTGVFAASALSDYAQLARGLSRSKLREIDQVGRMLADDDERLQRVIAQPAH